MTAHQITSHRLATLMAAAFSIGWTIAIGLALLSAVTQPAAPDASLATTLYERHELAPNALQFVNDNAIGWALFHLATTIALTAAIPLISYLSYLHPDDYKRPLIQPLGLIGAGAGLIANLIDQFSTPYLARLLATNSTIATFTWETIEPFRDAGLKTIAFLLLGLWLLWLVNGWENDSEKRPRQLTQLTGWGLLLLGLIEAIIHIRLSNVDCLTQPCTLLIFGETGYGGLTLILLPLWGFTIAHWFWQQELASQTSPEI